VFSNILSGVEVAFDETKFTAVACPQRGETLADAKEVYVLLNTELVVGLRLHDGAMGWLRGLALALKDEAVRRKAVEKARRVQYYRNL
jgi:hypothetical protein